MRCLKTKNANGQRLQQNSTESISESACGFVYPWAFVMQSAVNRRIASLLTACHWQVEAGSRASQTGGKDAVILYVIPAATWIIVE